MKFGTDWDFRNFYHDARDEKIICIHIFGVDLFEISGGKAYDYYHFSILGFWVEW